MDAHNVYTVGVPQNEVEFFSIMVAYTGVRPRRPLLRPRNSGFLSAYIG